MEQDATYGISAEAESGGDEGRVWAAFEGVGEVVREGGGTGIFRERHLQCVWGDVRLRPGGLKTSEGETVEVESAGEWNTGPGPDFLRAVLRVGEGGRRVCGDVEIHVRPVDWRSHGHGKDPRYRGVCAHVTYYTGVLGEGELPPGTLQIALRPLLEARADFSFEDIDLQAYPTAMRGPEPPCQAAMLELEAGARGRVLDAAGRQRLARRAEALRLAMADRGAGQVLYEEGMAALGYGGNKAAMRHLARVVPLAVLRERSGGDVLRAYSLLAGTAGLLPDATGRGGDWDAETREFVRQCWDEWWRLRGSGSGGEDFGWRRGGMRPANRPERRLMAAAALFAPADGMPERMERLAKRRDAGNFRRLAGVLETGKVPYWGRRLGYAGGRTGREVSLLGRGRKQAVTTNLLLPMLGALGAPEGMWNGLVAALPAEDGNRVTRTMAGRLFGLGGGGVDLGSGVRMQGLVHLHHEYCLEDRTGCERCPLAGQLRAWEGGVKSE